MATTQQQKPEAENETQAAVDYDARLAEAKAIVKSNVRWAAGLGLVPVPVLDLVTITAIQIRMLKKLSANYGVTFMEHKVKNILASLLIGAGSVKIGFTIAAGLFKAIPVVGPALGLVVVPVTAGALTHATGQVFIAHFESGGNFLDFEPEKARAHFKAEFERAEAELKTKTKKA